MKFMLCVVIILVPVSCITITSVTTVSIETNKDPAFGKLLTKLYVVVNVGDYNCEYNTGSPEKPLSWDEYKQVVKEAPLGDYLTATIEKKFQENGIKTKVMQVTGVELGKDQIIKSNNEIGASEVMLIQLTDGLVFSNGIVFHGIFDVSIRDISTEAMIWRAKITADGGKGKAGMYAYTGGVDPNKVVDSIISALRKDGLLATPAPAKSSA